MSESKPIVIIPARLGSTRLPNKPLLGVAGIPMIVHVWRRAVAAGIGPVIVACAEQEIVHVVEAEGGRAVLTAPELPSGSDRVFSALETIDPSGPGPGSTPVHDVVVNLQGDLPTIPPENIRAAVDALGPPGPPGGAADIGTLAAPLADEAEREDANVVKVALALAQGERRGRALAFSRAADPVAGAELFHHIGIYVYRRAALARFVRLPKSEAEMAQGLEQLRAMEAGMRIDAGVVDSVPLAVDTPADLERAREILG